jgi:hypothetical protein
MATTPMVSMTSDARNVVIKMEPPGMGACCVPTLVLIVPSPSVRLEATLGQTLCQVGAWRHLAEVPGSRSAWRQGCGTTALRRFIEERHPVLSERPLPSSIFEQGRFGPIVTGNDTRFAASWVEPC